MLKIETHMVSTDSTRNHDIRGISSCGGHYGLAGELEFNSIFMLIQPLYFYH
jgi:hypothetical protein